MNETGRKAFLAVSMISAMLGLTAKTSTAQDAAPSTSRTNEQKLDQEIDMMRKDVRSQKKQIIAANMKLTDQESEKFWPIYDRYTAELVKINDTKYALIKEYAQNDSMTDEQLDKSAKNWLQLDQSVAQLRIKYMPMFRNAISAKNTARFYQLDRRLVNMIDLQLASMLPLVEP